MAQERSDLLIAGAGPTGLAAALFLALRGIRCRVIDQADRPAETSRALVVNPRSLELLEPSGVAVAVLAEARPLQGVRFYTGWDNLAAMDLAQVVGSRPMSVLPQARTEALLARALAEQGVTPERGVALERATQDAAGVESVLLHANGRRETVRTALLLGADGAHSVVRKGLGLDFPGSAFAEPWPLYDLHLDDPLDLDHAHISFVPHGMIFMLALRPGLWRVLGNVAAPLDHLPGNSRPGEIAWQSNFHISHRVAERAAEGRIALAGDAAHIHSPVGARGMNLGIEDAFVYAACAADALGGRLDRIADYGRLRHAVHKTAVARIKRLTLMARGRPGVVSVARRYILPEITRIGPAARAMARVATGLDHPVQTT